MSILDCTLRDGGYYNDWDFSSEVVREYLKSVASAKIEYVELGLRNFAKPGFLGAFAYTTESFLNTLDLPVGPTYGVMVDAKTILEAKFPIEEAIDILFVPASESKISLVRVAAHFHEVERSEHIVRKLKKLGYIVGFNLMQAGGKDADVIAEKARYAASWEGLDVLYFADSLGNMDGAEVERVVFALRREWSGPLGIHTHNNMGKGLDNTLTAMNAGVTWLDSTVTGMGRGAGNTQTENLLAVLDIGESYYNPKPIYELVIRHFEPMQNKYGWGTNLLYFLGAQNEVHPTYIQNLLSNTHYGTDEIVGAIDYLSNLENTASYNGAILNTALTFTENNTKISGCDLLKGLFSRKSVLVLANGPSTEKYSLAIERYINDAKPIVISINIVESISQSLVDYYVISHNSKFLSDAAKYSQLKKPLILPKHRFNDEELNELRNLELIDYGLEVVKDQLVNHGDYSTVPYDNTSAYMFAILLEAAPEKISLVGFDGYTPDDARQQEMINTLNLYNNISGSKELLSLTPTSYPVTKGSIYAPF
jgi:4-hydroxy 2-oxovalerate aldolase